MDTNYPFIENRRRTQSDFNQPIVTNKVTHAPISTYPDSPVSSYYSNPSRAVVNPKRGQLYYIGRYNNVGAELDPKTGRPAVIVSRDEDNKTNNVVMIAYLTSSSKCAEGDTHCFVSKGSCVNSWVRCEQITTIDKALIGDYIGDFPDVNMEQLENCMRIALNLPVFKGENKTDKELQQELEMYKKMYNLLLEQVMNNKRG